MKRFLNLSWLIIPLALSPRLAHAYLDPGSGSYAVQVVIGVLFGATYTLKSFGGRIISRFKKQSGKSEEFKSGDE